MQTPTSIEILSPYSIDNEKKYILEFASIPLSTTDTLSFSVLGMDWAKIKTFKIFCSSLDFDINIYSDSTEATDLPNSSSSLYLKNIDKFYYTINLMNDIKIEPLIPEPLLFIDLKNNDGVNATDIITIEISLIEMKML